MITNHKRLYNIIIIVFFIIAILAVVALSFAYDSIRPIIYGACIAYVFKPMCNVYTRLFYKLAQKKFSIPKSKKIAHYTGIVATYITWAAIIYVFLAAVLPSLVRSIINIVNNLQNIMLTLNTYVNELLESQEELLKYYNIFSKELAEYWNQNRQKVLEWVTSLAGGMITGIINTLKFLFNLVVGFVVSVYVLSSRKKLGAQAKLMVKSVFDRKTADLIINEAAFADRMFSKYFVGSIIDSTIVGVVCFIGCTVMKMPYGLLVSFVVGVTNIIPFFGPYIGMFPSAVIICTASPVKALLFLIMMIVIQQIDGNILAPKIIGSNTGLPSFWVLFAILLFGGLFGFFGMIIGVPIFAVIYDVFGKLMRFCLQKRGQHEEIIKYEKEYLEEEQKPEKGFTRSVADNLKRKMTKSADPDGNDGVAGAPESSAAKKRKPKTAGRSATAGKTDPKPVKKRNARKTTADQEGGVTAYVSVPSEKPAKAENNNRSGDGNTETVTAGAEGTDKTDAAVGQQDSGQSSKGDANGSAAAGEQAAENNRTEKQKADTGTAYYLSGVEDEPWQMKFGDEL